MAHSNSTPQDDTDVLFICWTTLSSKEEAISFANAFVDEGIAACAQIDGPIRSIYYWDGERCCSTEYRLWLKVTASHIQRARERVNDLHPYDTPQWIETEAAEVDEKYLKWVKEASNLRGFQKPETI